MLFTNFTIGSIVGVVDGDKRKVMKIIDIHLVHIFQSKKKRGLYKAPWYRPIWFVVILVNEYRGLDQYGHDKLKNPYSLLLPYSVIEEKIKGFHV